MVATKIFLHIILLLAFISARGQNQLQNGGFEYPDKGWNFWGGQTGSSAKSGSYSMIVINEEAKWSGADQVITFPALVRKVEVEGWMKTENIIKGKNPWEMARIGVEFTGNDGMMVGGYPPVTGEKAGTSEWTYYQRSYSVPEGATKVKVQAVIGNATGKAWFDDIAVKLYDDQGRFVESLKLSGPSSEGEWYEVEVNPNRTGSHYVDWSSLLDAPAGKHGFLTVKDGRTRFEDGTVAKFWGTNLVAGACFPNKKTADSLATRLAKMGVNLVRFHHMDAPWARPNIFGNVEGTATLSKESLEKLDYLIYALKKKGIYIFMDLLVHRDFTVNGKVNNPLPDLGGKQVGYFDEKVIKDQKDYASQLLGHVNRYTKKAYKEEPAIIASEFINESTAFLHFAGDILNDHYRKELSGMFANEYPGKTLSILDFDYSSPVAPRVVERSGTKGDIKESIEFLNNIEKKYYREMYDYLKKNIGVKYLIAGSNFPIPVLPYQNNNAALDFVISNYYWDHPQVWKINNDWSRVLYAPLNNTAMLKSPLVTVVSGISKFKWHNKPFMVTEYNYCFPNEYRLEGAPFVAAYSALQGYDGMMQFDFDTCSPGQVRMNSLSLSRDVDQLAQWVIAAPVFLRGDVKEAPGLVYDKVDQNMINSLPLYDDYLEKNFHLPYITRVAKIKDNSIGDDKEKYNQFFDKDKQIIKSETGELEFDYQNGIFSINTSRVQGAEGALNKKEISLPLFKIKTTNAWISVMAVSKDGKPLVASDNFYLVVTTPVKMKDQKFNESRSALEELGDLPVLAQVAEGEINFNLKSKQITIFPINVSGEKKKPLILKEKNNSLKFNLSDGRSFVYEVLVK